MPKHIYFFLAVILIIGISTTGLASDGVVENGVVFWEQEYSQGSSTEAIPAGYYLIDDLKKYGFENDWASSVDIPEGWSVILYKDNYFEGESWMLNRMDSYSANFSNFGGDNQITSVQILINKTSPQGVVFYENSLNDSTNGGIRVADLYEGDYNAETLRYYRFVNNWASSVFIPYGYTVQLFNDDLLKNTTLGVDQWVLTKNDVDSANFDNINANDKVSSVRVRYGVTFYRDEEYNGPCTQGITEGYYTLEDLKKYGFFDDWASSVSIPDGWSVILYEDDNFGGQRWVLSPKDLKMDINCAHFTNLGANDKVSSIQVLNGAFTLADFATREGLYFFTREEWGARPMKPKKEKDFFNIITPELYYNTIVIHHTTRNANETIRDLEGSQLDNNATLEYHFVIGRDGTIYEGRPINIKGTHVANANSFKIGIAVMGNYHSSASIGDELQGALPIHPTEYQMTVISKLIKILKQMYPKIDRVGGHRDFNTGSTVCPGDYLYSELKNRDLI